MSVAHDFHLILNVLRTPTTGLVNVRIHASARPPPIRCKRAATFRLVAAATWVHRHSWGGDLALPASRRSSCLSRFLRRVLLCLGYGVIERQRTIPLAPPPESSRKKTSSSTNQCPVESLAKGLYSCASVGLQLTWTAPFLGHSLLRRSTSPSCLGSSPLPSLASRLGPPSPQGRCGRCPPTFELC